MTVKDEKGSPPAKRPDDPGLFDSIGSFPVWMLLIIDLLTPHALLKKIAPSPKKESPLLKK